MNTLLRISKTPGKFLWLRRYGLKWFNSNPVKLTFIREADPERKVPGEARCQQLPGNHEMEQNPALSRMKDLRLQDHKTQESIKFPSSEGSL